MPTGDKVSIPFNVIVRCPLRDFQHRLALHCERCTHFAGLTELAGGGAPFHRTYTVRCGYPIDRELSVLTNN